MGAVALKGRSVTHADGDYLRACIDEELRLRAAPGGEGAQRQGGNTGFQNEFRTRRAAIYPDPRFSIPESAIYPRSRFIYPGRFFLIPETALTPKRALLYT